MCTPYKIILIIFSILALSASWVQADESLGASKSLIAEPQTQTSFEELSKKIQSLQQTEISLRSRLAKAAKRQRELEARLAAENAENTDDAARYKEKDQKIKHLSQENDTLKKIIEEKNVEIAEVQKAAHDTSNARAAQSKQEIANLKNETQKFRNEIKVLEQQNEQYNQSLLVSTKELEIAQRKINHLIAQQKELQDTIDTLEQHNRALSAQGDTLKDIIEAKGLSTIQNENHWYEETLNHLLGGFSNYEFGQLLDYRHEKEGIIKDRRLNNALGIAYLRPQNPVDPNPVYSGTQSKQSDNQSAKRLQEDMNNWLSVRNLKLSDLGLSDLVGLSSPCGNHLCLDGLAGPNTLAVARYIRDRDPHFFPGLTAP